MNRSSPTQGHHILWKYNFAVLYSTDGLSRPTLLHTEKMLADRLRQEDLIDADKKENVEIILFVSLI